MEFETAFAKVREYIGAAKSENTRRAYASDWRHFVSWCEANRTDPLGATPEFVALYLATLADSRRPSTITRRLSSISKAFQAAGLPSPARLEHSAVSETLKGIRRIKGIAPGQKEPLLTADVRRMLETLPRPPLGARDRALLLLGFAGGFRRSELASLDVDDLRTTEDGLIVRVKRSKTDPEAEGRNVAVPYGTSEETCPVRATVAWVHTAAIQSGPLFRGVSRQGRVAAVRLNKDSIGRIVKRMAADAGLDPVHYAGHSLRAGMATQASMNGASELSIMRQTGHRSVAMVRRYIREGSLFRDNPAGKLGL
jgi:integrase